MEKVKFRPILNPVIFDVYVIIDTSNPVIFDVFTTNKNWTSFSL